MCNPNEHQYSEKTCVCGEIFCYACCGGTNVDQGGKHELDYMYCPVCKADFYAEPIIVRGFYFKYMPDEVTGISGCNLPNPNRIYHFINCSIHPRLWEAMTQMYSHCLYTNTYTGTTITEEVK
jgi:hypothetical protein